MKIGSKTIGHSRSVFIIAEAGVNHNNSLSLAFKMIDLAAKSGADAIKFQSFITENMQLKESKKPRYQNKLPWSYFEQLKKSESSFDFQKKLIKYCKKKKIIFLSTPYDEESIDFLVKMKIPAFKISASDTTNHLLLKYVAKQKKPIILSTGLSTIEHVDEAVKLMKKLKMKNKLILLQTTSDYPTPNNDVNLRVMSEYISRYALPVGLSDHTTDYVASLGAVAMGACVLEKHFTLNKKLSGPDQSSSLSPIEFKTWIKKVRTMEIILGTSNKFITKSEKENLTMRKILIIKPTKKDTKITLNILSAKRGRNNGVLPLEKNINKILGKKLKHTINSEIQFNWNMID
jgi:sialic acid synthase SpsE